jgi:hypothetical protein
MNDAFIKNLAPAVRDRFHSIPDGHFDDVPEVIELRAELASAKKAHSVVLKEHDKIRAAIADAGRTADTARQMLGDLEAGRGYALAVALVNGDVDFDDDERTVREIHALRLTIERVGLARPGLERILGERLGELEDAAGTVLEKTRKLTDKIDELKLDLAYRLAR